jgi:hypothetical protein
MSSLAKNFIAEAAVPAYRITKPGAAAGKVLVAAAATDKLNGVSHEISAAIGERVDVHKSGIRHIEAGGAFAVGDPLTSDGVGRAILANPAAGANARIIAFAEEQATALGDIVYCQIVPGVMQG